MLPHLNFHINSLSSSIQRLPGLIKNVLHLLHESIPYFGLYTIRNYSHSHGFLQKRNEKGPSWNKLGPGTDVPWRNMRVQLAPAGDYLPEFEIIEDGRTLPLTEEQMQAKFAEHFKDAERLIHETGYHRRDAELEQLRGFF